MRNRYKGPYDIFWQGVYLDTVDSLREARRYLRGLGVRIGKVWHASLPLFGKRDMSAWLYRKGQRVGCIRSSYRTWKPTRRQWRLWREAARKAIETVQDRHANDMKVLTPWEPYGGEAGFSRYSMEGGVDQVSVNGGPVREGGPVSGFLLLHGRYERVEGPTVEGAMRIVDDRCRELGWTLLNEWPEDEGAPEETAPV